MAHVSFTSHLKTFFPTLAEAEVPARTVRELIDALNERYPGLASYLVDETGRLRRHVNIFIGDEPVGDREKLSDSLEANDKVFIVQALSGG
jgi:molybdopterin converting factor small subunit